MLCNAMLYYAVLCGAMPCYAMLCYAMLCYAMLCYTMPCYAILCYARLCNAIENRSEIDSKTIQNRSRIHPKSVQNRSKIGFGTDLAANIDFGPSCERFQNGLGRLLAASWRLLGGHSGIKSDQKPIFGGRGWHSKTHMMLDTLLNQFLVRVGTILGSEIEPKSVKKRPQER